MAFDDERFARPTAAFLFVPTVLLVLVAAPLALAVEIRNTSTKMTYKLVGAEEKTPAKWRGRFSCEKVAGSFEVSGKCYICEKGKRNLLGASCVVPAHDEFKPVSKKASATGLLRTDCPSGYFLHRLSGTCYSCPSGYNRTLDPDVEGKNACSRHVNAVFTDAVVAKDKSGAEITTGCPSDSFRNLLADQCYSCPSGFNRSLTPGIDLTKLNDACVGRFYRRFRPGQGETYASSSDASGSWKFSLYTETGGCLQGPVKGGVGGDVPQGPCHIATFAVPVNGRADFREGMVSISSKDGKLQDRYCPNLQPPDHTTGTAPCTKTFASTEPNRIPLPGEVVQ